LVVIDRARLQRCSLQEQQRFVDTHPRSELFERAKAHLLAGVPMNWMVRWAGTSHFVRRRPARISPTWTATRRLDLPATPAR
jgi:hypothetical protein